MQSVTTALLWFSAIGCGLLAGLYFAFSTFIMTALGRIDQASGINAMNAINVVIVRSLFLPFFFGTSLASLLLVLLALLDWSAPGAWAMLVGGLIYVLGMFVCTILFNVPLNNRLALVDPAGMEGRSVWQTYLKQWTAWNHVRTIACTLASGLFIHAIAVT